MGEKGKGGNCQIFMKRVSKGDETREVRSI
jgi:hypothetical protein